MRGVEVVIVPVEILGTYSKDKVGFEAEYLESGLKPTKRAP